MKKADEYPRTYFDKSPQRKALNKALPRKAVFLLKKSSISIKSSISKAVLQNLGSSLKFFYSSSMHGQL